MATDRARSVPLRRPPRTARSRPNLLALAGAGLGLAAILGGSALEGISVTGLINLPAAVIVLGGTFGAVILQTPGPVLRQAWARLGWVLATPDPELGRQAERVADWARQVRRGGLVSLEEIAAREQDPFIRTGIGLVADGGEALLVRRTLELESDNRLSVDLAAAGVYRSLGGYAPTIGIVGAVLGLIQVMSHLAEPEHLGSGIATAFVATIYGVGSANLIFLPLAERLRAIAEAQWQRRSLVVDGLMCVIEGEHPGRIRNRLSGYLTEG